jgi:hypothetical protein
VRLTANEVRSKSLREFKSLRLRSVLQTYVGERFTK